ncbi:oligogalacturonate lyase family protein, partial [Eubacteriales bacterium OttesenSCG-928-A19]|nr:oligogalacturonate lyase family protein [Eubacteriales bacterium OttesenSCG-928-A19]
MKGQKIQFHPTEVSSEGGISPKVVRLTDPEYTCNHLYFHNRSFSPDDKTVVFESTLDGGNNLFAMDLATGMVTQLTEGRQL